MSKSTSTREVTSEDIVDDLLDLLGDLDSKRNELTQQLQEVDAEIARHKQALQILQREDH